MTPWSCGFAVGTSFPSKRMRTRSEIIRLRISFHNPEMVKSMLPELTARGVSSMRFAAILAECQVGTWFSIGGKGGQEEPVWGGSCSLLQEHSGYLYSVGHYRWGRPCERSCSNSCCDPMNSSGYKEGLQFSWMPCRRSRSHSQHWGNGQRRISFRSLSASPKYWSRLSMCRHA